MDKEEAIKILKDFHDKSALFSVRTALETLHPELKESEDKEIREQIVYAINKLNVPGSEKNKLLAWLEKQGESSDQIHFWTEEEIEPIISDYLRGAEHYGGMIGRLRCLKPKPLEKQGTSYTKSDVDDAYLKGISDAKNELEKQGEQKPQRMISAEAKEAMYNKPAYAWSEEDKRMFDYALDMIEWYGGKNEKRVRLVSDWLESIKERYTWKPSDAQITVLELASKYERVFTPKQIDILIGLKEQLKKLKGE